MHSRLFVVLLVILHHETGYYAATAASGGCQRRCGGSGTPVPYPFGFSPGCLIALSCDANTSTPFLPSRGGGGGGDSNGTSSSYRVISFNSTASAVLIGLPPACSRSVHDARAALSGANYGVSSRTGLFLRGGCREANASVCSVPEGVMSGLLRAARCGGENGTSSAGDGVACVASTAPNATAPGMFLRWDKAENTSCHDVLTSAAFVNTADGTATVEFGVAELAWWLDGTCAGGGGHGPCAANATCSDVRTPTGEAGHRCACVAGMDGDGFLAGDGCYLAKTGSNKNVAFIVGGVVVGLAAATGILILLCMAQRRRSSSGGKGRSGRSRLAAMRLLSEAASSSGVPVYSYSEVARATNSFSHTHRLGTGAYGTVYVGRLPPSSSTAPLVAIKRLRCRHDDDDGRTVALLLNEIRLISSLSHPNLVRLLGCCLDRGEHILVYELVPNGTLAHHLHNHSGSGGATLPWRARLGVAAGTAAAVAYLHAARPPIFHRDVKSGNILLGADLRAKLADFGLSRGGFGPEDDASRSHVSTAPQGTPGYVDPDYHQSFHLSDKSDVYSFGVVLLELITAMRVVDFARPPSEVNLASLALDRIGKGRVEEIVDPALLRHHHGIGEEWVMESVRHVSELAFRCLAFDKDVRPSMSEVAHELCQIRDAAPDSGIAEPVADEHVAVQNTVMKARSPVSVQEVWVSDQSSPSTNGSMPRFA